MAGEARIAAGAGVAAIAAPPSRLSGWLETLDGSDFAAVVSFGIAGGLEPALHAGDIVVASTIADDERDIACIRGADTRLARILAENGIRPHRGRLAAATRPVLTPEDKQRMGRTRHAIAVDTESLLGANFAARHGLPFVALRAIADPAHQALPPLAVRAIGPNGRLDAGAILFELARRPGQLIDLPATGLATRRAMTNLRRARAVLGPGLGLLG